MSWFMVHGHVYMTMVHVKKKRRYLECVSKQATLVICYSDLETRWVDLKDIRECHTANVTHQIHMACIYSTVLTACNTTSRSSCHILLDPWRIIRTVSLDFVFNIRVFDLFKHRKKYRRHDQDVSVVINAAPVPDRSVGSRGRETRLRGTRTSACGRRRKTRRDQDGRSSVNFLPTKTSSAAKYTEAVIAVM